MDREKLAQLRSEGLTYQEIGKLFGVSKQRIYQVIGRCRKNSVDISKIKYPKVREFFNSNDLSYSAVTELVIGNRDKASAQKITKFFKGEQDNIYLNSKQWVNMCKLFNMTMEEW